MPHACSENQPVSPTTSTLKRGQFQGLRGAVVPSIFLLTVLVLLAAARFVLGLCDGNHCESGQAGRDRGNGRIVVSLFKEFSQPRNHCHWVPEKVISIPATAAFTSYAGLATRGNQLLISSKVRRQQLLVLERGYSPPVRASEFLAILPSLDASGLPGLRLLAPEMEAPCNAGTCFVGQAGGDGAQQQHT